MKIKNILERILNSNKNKATIPKENNKITQQRLLISATLYGIISYYILDLDAINNRVTVYFLTVNHYCKKKMGKKTINYIIEHFPASDTLQVPLEGCKERFLRTFDSIKILTTICHEIY